MAAPPTPSRTPTTSTNAASATAPPSAIPRHRQLTRSCPRRQSTPRPRTAIAPAPTGCPRPLSPSGPPTNAPTLSAPSACRSTPIALLVRCLGPPPACAGGWRLTASAENEIVGEALVALQHDDLKSMGIASVGHRLTILKSVYDVKKAQDVPIESDHYLPPCKHPPAASRSAQEPRRLTCSVLCSCRRRSSICHGDAQGHSTFGGAAAPAG